MKNLNIVNTQLLFALPFVFFFLFNTGLVNAQDVYLCVWRNPERTMTKNFPEAKDYSTINLKVTPQQCDSIEKSLVLNFSQVREISSILQNDR